MGDPRPQFRISVDHGKPDGQRRFVAGGASVLVRVFALAESKELFGGMNHEVCALTSEMTGRQSVGKAGRLEVRVD